MGPGNTGLQFQLLRRLKRQTDHNLKVILGYGMNVAIVGNLGEQNSKK